MQALINKHPETAELVESINEAIVCISKLSEAERPGYYCLAFFGIFVKFQKIVREQFEHYCLGEQSSSGYCPERKHVFHDISELRSFLKTRSEYIDYDERIYELAEYIFEDNPFSNLFSIEPQGYLMLKSIRNHIGHESDSSYKKLYDARIIRDDQTISTYFAMRSKRNKIHFDELVLSIYEFSNYIIEG